MSERRTVSRKTNSSVILVDRVARFVITLGGIGTILAVVGVAVFLFVVAAPLFSPASLTASDQSSGLQTAGVLYVETDDKAEVGVLLDDEGGLRFVSLREGKVISEQRISDRKPTAISTPRGTPRRFAVAFDDGTIQLGKLTVEEKLLSREESANLEGKTSFARGNAWVSPSVGGRWRQVSMKVSLDEPIDATIAGRIISLDFASSKVESMIGALSDDGRVTFFRQRFNLNPLAKIKGGPIAAKVAAEPSSLQPRPTIIRVNSNSAHALALAETGEVHRFQIDDVGQGRWMETLASDNAGDRLLRAEWVLGQETLVAAYEGGRVRSGFFARTPSSAGRDEFNFQWTQELRETGDSPAIGLSPSSASRLIATSFADGSACVYLPTLGRPVVSLEAPSTKPSLAALSPHEDALALLSDSAIHLYDLEKGHPEVSLNSLFLPVWYEGYAKPTHVWQTDTGGQSEPKFGLMPLLFGSIKTTIYSMLFAAPLAFFAAIYTSEFLHPRWRSRVKPTIELMASLPSVVLGFLGAIVVAPWVAGRLAETLTVFILIPLVLLLAGHLWQLLPSSITLRAQGWRFPLACATLPLSVWLANQFSPMLERVLFGGDMIAWLSRQDPSSNGMGGWMLLLLPLSALFVAGLMTRVDSYLQVHGARLSRLSAALVALVRFLAGLLAVVGIAWLVALALTMAGIDSRGSILDSYAQRNAFVVSIVMAFALIPLIFTIADDALSTVPAHLRSASLGAGATPWQTAVHIVVPTAMSGLFSALIIGFGRAIGETMIVLMAAGNTPIIDWNIFNGFRTLSANLATELPEADVGSTHYRTLFFSAVVLFLVTSVLNSFAEAIRLRFRRRAFQL